MGKIEAIDTFAGVIVENERGEVLLVKKEESREYAVPWCRVEAGKPVAERLRERVLSLTGLDIQPVFLTPGEEIDAGRHIISFDHLARIAGGRDPEPRSGLTCRWVKAEELDLIPLVPMSARLLHRHFSGGG